MSSFAAGSWDAHGFGANMTIQLNKLSAAKKYKLSNINFLNPATRKVVDGAHESFRDAIGLRPGGVYTKYELMEVLDHLSSSVYFEKIEFDAKTNPDGTVDLNVPYKERVFPSKTMFRCLSVGMLPDEEPIEIDPKLTINEREELVREMNERHHQRNERAGECVLPVQVQDEIEWTLRQKPFVRASQLSSAASRIQNWYHDHGYSGARVVSFFNLENRGGEVVFEVDEGDIDTNNNVGVKFVDTMGNICQGNTNIKLIKRALPHEFVVGRGENQRAKQSLFSNMNIVLPRIRINLRDEISVAVSAVKTGWNLVPAGPHSLPNIDLMRPPGAAIKTSIKGLNRPLDCGITFGNIFEPDQPSIFDCNLDYTRPFLDRKDKPRNRTLQATCFVSRNFSPVFGGLDAAPTLVHRQGIKATVTQDYKKQTKLNYGLMVEDIKTQDVYGGVFTRGQTCGTPTTLSGTGNDRLAFLQANITKDDTRFVNGALVGAKDVFQVDQGIGIGTKFAFFNRAKVSATRFIPLTKVKENAAPPTLVLHGLFGTCLGNLPNHEAFTIGGPHSVRGYDVGGIGASRSKLEVAAEVRIPVKNATLYGFAEHGNDLGCSSELAGNPTASYNRRGHGSSYGVGVKFGPVRAEYAVDHNKQKGGFFLHCGDRF